MEREERLLEGVLAVDKPEGWTSFDVVAKVRGITRCRKIGHGGTLDPMATGVLPLFFGRSAKAADFVPLQEKRYLAEVRFGERTDTLDATGTVLERSGRRTGREAVEAALVGFRGEILQRTPMYSARRVGGERLYRIARGGRVVDRPVRRVGILALELLEFREDAQTAVLDIRCSKGTYVRVLADDLGTALGTGAVLTGLRRTEDLGFTGADCRTLEELRAAEEEGRFPSLLLGVDRLLEAYPAVRLSPRRETLFRNGVRLDARRTGGCPPDGIVRVYADGRFLGLGRTDRESGELRLLKLLCPERKETGSC